jgi:hypothetical protein
LVHIDTRLSGWHSPVPCAQQVVALDIAELQRARVAFERVGVGKAPYTTFKV